MIRHNIAVYMSSEREGTFVGCIAEHNLFVVIESEALDKEHGENFLKSLSHAVSPQAIHHLSDFEALILEKLKHSHIPPHTSLAATLVQDDKCLVKTMGGGEIYIRRGGQFAKLISRDTSASGYVNEKDFLVITTSQFTQKLVDESQLSKLTHEKSPTDIKDILAPLGSGQESAGLAAIFVQFSESQTTPGAHEVTKQQPEQNIHKPQTNRVRDFITSVKDQYQKHGKKKTLTFLAVAAIFLILLWSVIFGYIKRANARVDQAVETSREVITENLTQAEEVAFLNVGRAQALIADSKKELAELKKIVGNKKKKDVRELEMLISQKEGAIFNKEEKPAEEFYDLSVDNENAKGAKLSLDKETLAILDPSGSIYALSLTKKSLDKKSPKDVKNISLIGVAEDSIFAVSSQGVFQLTDSVKKIIDHDKDWGRVVGMATFSNNLYFLDISKNQIYKHTPTDGGYSAKTSYLKSGQKVNFSGGTSIAIDSSVYVGLPDRILKFTEGLQDDFSTTFADPGTILTKIYTNEELEKVYGWDKKKGALYVLAKTGSYERQIKSAMLEKASDFVVYGDHAYLLLDAKIYRISVE